MADTSLFLHELRALKSMYESLSVKLKVIPKLIEKDYWIMHCLWGLADLGFKFELKGGTSLSKGFKIISRFSEDIDIKIYPPEGLNLKTGKNDSKPHHVEERKKFFDGLVKKIKINGIVSVERDYNFDDSKMRNAGIRIHYDSKFTNLTSVKEGVLLEVGFDETTPNEPINISSWLYDAAKENNLSFKDNIALNVPCYCPEYTFVEKLQTISTKYRKQQDADTLPTNFVRHYYDIYKLLDEKRIQQFIGTEEYHRHKEKRFRPKDEKDLTKNEAFILSDAKIFDLYKTEYDRTSDLYYREKPEFADILKRIKEYLKNL